jgi:DNA-binding transcriptional MerR regulator
MHFESGEFSMTTPSNPLPPIVVTPEPADERSRQCTWLREDISAIEALIATMPDSSIFSRGSLESRLKEHREELRALVEASPSADVADLTAKLKEAEGQRDLAINALRNAVDGGAALQELAERLESENEKLTNLASRLIGEGCPPPATRFEPAPEPGELVAQLIRRAETEAGFNRELTAALLRSAAARIEELEEELEEAKQRLEAENAELRKERDRAWTALDDLARDRVPHQCLVARPGEGTLECRAESLCAACVIAGKMVELRKRAEQAEVQLAGCGAAALGYIDPAQLAKPGDYGYSASYGDVVKLRERAEEAEKRASEWDSLDRVARVIRAVATWTPECVRGLQTELARRYPDRDRERWEELTMEQQRADYSAMRSGKCGNDWPRVPFRAEGEKEKA